LIGLAAYRRRDGRIAFTHTEVDEALAGRGFGSRLAGAALDDAARLGLDVVPLCPFIARYIERHTEYAGLLPKGYRTEKLESQAESRSLSRPSRMSSSPKSNVP
jgi:predicted GNAT family acetyltransferase